MKAFLAAPLHALLIAIAAPAWADIGRDEAAAAPQRADVGRVLSVDRTEPSIARRGASRSSPARATCG